MLNSQDKSKIDILSKEKKTDPTIFIIFVF